MYFPFISMFNECLVLDKMRASTSVSEMTMPFIMVNLLNTYEYAPTLGAFALAVVISNGPVLPIPGGRPPVSNQGENGGFV